jgi:alkaline phosphatase D
MTIIRSICLSLILFLIGCSSAKPDMSIAPMGTQDEYVIAFGSCNKQWEPQPMWKTIVSNNPLLWIWTGDIIYADTEDMKTMEEMYAEQKSKPEYQLLHQQCPIIGIWDDHDFGVNNGGKEYAAKDGSKAQLLNFLEVPKTDPVWSHPGSYQSYSYQIGKTSVKIILLDVRYFRDPRSNPNGTVLGAEQWTWFEKELLDSKADINLIAGGVQFLHLDHDYEKWSIYPAEYQKLLRTIANSKAKNPILISGDRHIAEIAIAPLPNGKMIHEITSSGLTHSYSTLESETNRYRVGPLVTQKNFGMIKINETKKSIILEIRNVENALLSSHVIPM